MSEMVERVARAICEGKGYDPEYPVSETKVQWETFIETARIAIEAMREPTKDMIEEGFYAVSVSVDAPSGPIEIQSDVGSLVWRLMIRQALSDND